jgi:hypothetical protein
MAMATTGVDELFDLSRRILDRGKQLLEIAQRVDGPQRERLLHLSEGLLQDANKLSDTASQIAETTLRRR